MDALTFNTKHLLYTLFESGVRYFVISPGSRSTPIALLLAEYAENNQAINLFVDVDERSAGFFALGIAKTVLEPVVLLGTSGTAIAEYMPAIAEASVSNVPLVVLSTDRPQELQHNGAPQTISQNNLFGHQTKEAIEINLQDQHSDVTNYIDFMIQRLVHLSMMVPRGPIQINLPLRKPLMPILKDSHKITVNPLTFEEQVPQYQPILIHAKRLLILAGPNVLNSYDEVLNQFAAENHVPIITDVLSRSRGENTVYGIDMLLEMNRIPVELNPDLVIRFGKTPVSARVLQWLKNRHIETWHIDEDAGTDHTRHISRAINMAPKNFLNSSQLTLSDEQKSFNQKWQVLPKSQSVDNEMSVVPAIDNAVADNTHIFVANSMPIRDMDNFFSGLHTKNVFANRGANGIDGVISSALGMAASRQQRSLLLTGDLTLFHDMNGLMMAKNYLLPLDIVVINNNGGGIFSFLPQAEVSEYFEQLFGTPLNIDVSKIAHLYDLHYTKLNVPEELSDILKIPVTGTRLIEYQSNRRQNKIDHNNALRLLK